jgi:hypothetical protein
VELTCGSKFILEIFSSALIFSNFSKILFQNFMPNIFFSNISSKICSPALIFSKLFLQISSYEFLGLQFFDTDLLYLNIFIQLV